MELISDIVNCVIVGAVILAVLFLLLRAIFK